MVMVLLLAINFFISLFSISFGKNVRGKNLIQTNTVTVNQTNFLFIIFDDLRLELSIYGRKHMITPNFERLAQKSVIFDNAYCQVAVCNPSRDSMLTGLRPDTTGTYSFQWSFRPHMIFPTRLRRSGYTTAGYGKVSHWDSSDTNVWSHDHWDGDWYGYQVTERQYMNASTMPDKTRPEEFFRDHRFTTKTIKAIRTLSARNTPYMVSIGFKLPHLAVHLPHKYFDMYRERQQAWVLPKKELRYPPTSPAIAYRCCADPTFRYMKEEGLKNSEKSINLGRDVDSPIPEDMRNELMWGYCGAVTFIDKQIGRILDVLDELSLWDNLTVILTSDHGIHNGEKGLWEKWTTFDESTRVPLLIHHPQSPFKGRHYTPPVELVDLFPTINDLTQAPYNKDEICTSDDPKGIYRCLPLQGRSLASVVLGEGWSQHSSSSSSSSNVTATRGARRRKGRKNAKGRSSVGDRRALRSHEESRRTAATSSTNSSAVLPVMPILEKTFAISQTWRCASKSDLKPDIHVRKPVWRDCSRDDNLSPRSKSQVSIMGYSMRTIEFRYTAWLYFNRTIMATDFDTPPVEEELYDHRGETLDDYTHLETVNLANKPSFAKVVTALRNQLLTYLRQNIVFHGPYPVGR